ncbi:MAG: RHS repeat-associated core domain-containing protein, partial [Pyrinomonadaceae bacterium]
QQHYVYDRWGNRTIHQTNTWGFGINKKDFTVNTANNRLGVPSGQSGVMTYDNAGNLITETYTGAGSRVYDAENRMTKAWGGNNQWQEYGYNADGQRTRRKIDGVETRQVYGMDGQLLAEYAASAAPSSPQKEYGHRNGQLLIIAEPSNSPAETVWLEDSVPAGASIAGDNEGWNWIGSNPGPASGSLAHQSNIVSGVHQHYFYNATATLTVNSGDRLFAYVYLDPANLPSEVMLQWNDGAWEHRAYWGANLLTWGTDGTDSRRYIGPLPGAGGWVRLEVAASQVGLEGRTLNGMAFSLWGGRATWDRVGKTTESVWVEDAVPAGATTAGDGEGWNWISASPSPASGSVAHQSNIVSGVHQHYFYNATATLTVNSGDRLFAYVYLDPANVPSELMLQWNDGAWEHRAYWGANNLTWGTDGTDSRRYMGPLPGAGSWVRLEVAASQVGLEGRTLNGMAFSLWGGRATWDRAGKSPGSGSSSAQIQWLVADQLGTPRMIFDKTGSLATTKRHDYLPFGEELFAGLGGRTPTLGYTSDTVRQKLTLKERDNETGLDYFLARYYSSTQGRFTSVDPDNAGVNEDDPQSWNGYADGRNNPIVITDPDGL